MGQIEKGPEGLRFAWWDCATMQDKRFAEILLGKTTVSSAKLEAKLTIERNGHTTKKLFLLVQALHFRNVDYFAGLLQARTLIPVAGQEYSVEAWLNRFVSPLDPEFREQCRNRSREALPQAV